MANPTKEAKKNNSKPAKKNLPIKKFFGKEGIFIGLDKDNFVGVVAYTRIDLIIYTDERSDEIGESIKKISRHVKYLIDSSKIGVDDVIYDKVNTNYNTGRTFMFQSIYVPYTHIYGKIFNGLKRLKNVENENLAGKASFSFRTKNSMRILVNPDKSKNKDVFLKGYISSVLIPPVYVKGELKTEEKFMLKSNLFVSDDIGFTIDDIVNINRKELTKNTVSIFGSNSMYKNGSLYVKVNTENEPRQFSQYYTKDKKDIYHECPKPLKEFEPGVNYYNSYKVQTSSFIPFKRRINLIVYQADSIKENGVLNFCRESFEIGLFFRSFKDEKGKYKEDFDDPLGIFIKVRDPDKVSTGDIRDLIRDRNGNSILYGADNKVSFDMETFNDEAEILNENFINILEKEENVQPQPPKEENTVEEEISEEKEEKMEEEETFNDVGSLADIDLDDNDLENNVEDEEAAEIAAESEAPANEESSEEIELPKEEE